MPDDDLQPSSGLSQPDHVDQRPLGLGLRGDEVSPEDTLDPQATDPTIDTPEAPSDTTHRPVPRTAGQEDPPPPSPAVSELSASQSRSMASDRVFPIRSVIKVDPNLKPHVYPDTANAEESPFDDSSRHSSRSRPSQSPGRRKPSRSEVDMPPRPHKPRSSSRRGSASTVSHRGRPENPRPLEINTDSASTKSERMDSAGSRQGSSHASSVKSPRSAKDSDTGDLYTSRFKHVLTEEGHAVITGRDGDRLQRCEDEPIHIPGAIQGFGVLVALQEEGEGKLVVRVVSENSKRLLGHTPRQLFELESFSEIFSDEQADNLFDHIDFIRDDDVDPATNGPEVFTISIKIPHRRSQKLWCAMHVNEADPSLIICEFELEDDQLYPLVPAENETPQPPQDTLDSTPTEEEYTESTENISKPLRVLRSARKRRGEAAAMEVFNILSQVQEQLAGAPNLEKFLKILVGVVKELTGFHRVMIYQFDQSFNGKVVTELVDPRATKDLYHGLHFPASDIPKQARDMYKVNKVRLLYDRDQETSRLVCRTVEDLESPLDLTYAYLRAMSPIHIKYLGNMAVRSSMSISINAFNELWGLVSCHAYGSKGTRVSFPIRKMCRLVGDAASRNIERLSYASRLQARKLINTAPTEKNPSGYIIASSNDLLKLFDADFGLLCIKDETKILGKIDESQELLVMLEYLRMRKFTSVMTCNDINEEFPDLKYSPGFKLLAGLLVVPLSVGGYDFIVFFRRGQLKEVKWAGNPYEKFIRQGTEGYLEPRKSFKTWRETVVGKCREWTEDQIETAAVLCLVYGKFIEVWRQKEKAMQNSQLTRILLANSAHEVRTPLNAIINYLEIALEGAVDSETRDNLLKSHSASKSLIYVINDLLDLTRTENGNDLIRDEAFELMATVREAVGMFSGDAKRKNIDYDLVEHPGLPHIVIGDQRRVRQVVSNVTANAIQHTSQGGVKIEIWQASRIANRAEIEISIQDTGVGMSNKKLDALFRELEQVQSESHDVDILQDSMPSESKALTEGEQGKTTLGLGLAVVARIIRTMNGQLRLSSEESKGSNFIIQLGFDLPDSSEGQEPLPQIAEPVTPSTPPATDEGMILVRSRSPRPLSPSDGRGQLSRKDSGDSVYSRKSLRSLSSARSAKSDVDRLIDAIQEPHLLERSHSQDEGALIYSPSKTNPETRSERHTALISAHKGPNNQNEAHWEGSQAVSALSGNLKSAMLPPGQKKIVDTKTPLKPVKVPDNFESSQLKPGSHPAPRAMFEASDRETDQRVVEHKMAEPLNNNRLRILVAEDDLVNSKIIKKRLEKIGHDVYLTVNGEECASAYGDSPGSFDVVLMDMQMPIVDGLASVKMIRSFEKARNPDILSPHAALNGRIPIFAVSASLLEKDRRTYVDCGFDAWILKPIDFKRLNLLLEGIIDGRVREDSLYVPGKWERGGWFGIKRSGAHDLDTSPSGRHTPALDGMPEDPFTDVKPPP
ncbi:MAG: hypothetical protein M1819_001838 [Sarea resinae]|nr:MAG: hypothetical protein M1819_001838 [Sarea resinae]